MKDLPLDEVYFFLLERTVRQFRKFSKSEFVNEGIDLSGEQWVVLKRVSEKEGIKQKEIANLTYKDPASVTRIIDLLQKKGWIERKSIEGDRRAYALFLTAAGKKLVEQVTPLAKSYRTRGLKGVSKKDLEILKKTLNKIHDNFS